jgi:AcrR family transcriptional regulator
MAVPDPSSRIATTDGRVPGRRGRATRQRLVEATAELLVATPWRSIKVIDIARAAGTSPATFYQYFENVEAVITVLAEGLVEEAGELAALVDGDWSEAAGWGTAVAVVRGFMDYWERNRSVFRVVELVTVEGDHRFQGLRVRALNAVTVTLAKVIATEAKGDPAGADPMAAAGTLIAMLAQVSSHRYGFEFWGIRTAALVDSQARLLLWAVTGRAAPEGAQVEGAGVHRPRTGPVVGGGAAAARTAQFTRASRAAVGRRGDAAVGRRDAATAAGRAPAAGSSRSGTAAARPAKTGTAAARSAKTGTAAERPTKTATAAARPTKTGTAAARPTKTGTAEARQRSATGLTGEPSPPVMGRGVASRRKV